MSHINYVSDEKDADNYLKMYENCESYGRKNLSFPEVHEDPHALAEVTISLPTGNEITCIVSKTESCIIHSPNRMQISKASPVGAFIANNLKSIKVGTKLPNGATILKIGFINAED